MSESKKKLTPWQQAISGSTAGVIARIVISPIDVIKIRLQTQANPKNTTAKYTGVIQTAQKVVREEGWRALWKGNFAAELLYLTYGGAQFLFYDIAEKNFKQYVLV
jgi:solute carrier family 25 thiamine pyrophosphate transporter 19